MTRRETDDNAEVTTQGAFGAEPVLSRSGKVAILIVNGGQDPEGASWLELCLSAVRDRTVYPDYHLYVWNNNQEDETPKRLSSKISNLTLVDADPKEPLSHEHAVPLERLHQLARRDGATYIVTLDTDALPIKTGWLTELVTGLEQGAAIAGVWHAETAIDPYLHPSCLATTAAFLKAHNLHFDYLPIGTGKVYDTASNLTRVALDAGLPLHRLHLSNWNRLHPVIGSVYGDCIYHHGAGSRGRRAWWLGQKSDARTYYRNVAIRDLAAKMLLRHRQEYLSWLSGTGTERVHVVLGMHRSGTSCLTACLEECGLNLGAVNRLDVHAGSPNFERPSVESLNDAILEASGGSWRSPPASLIVNDRTRRLIAEQAADLSSNAPAGLKDPRIVLMAELWFEAFERPGLIGTFRHPGPVARSMRLRHQMPETEAYSLWTVYNRRLMDLHKVHGFPLVAYDLSDPESYTRRVAEIAIELNLAPKLAGLRRIVNPRLEHQSPQPDEAIPPECREVYAYLLENSRREPSEPGGFPSLLLEWGDLLETPPRTRWKDRAELWALQQALRLPRRLRKPLVRPAHWLASRGLIRLRYYGP